MKRHECQYNLSIDFEFVDCEEDDQIMEEKEPNVVVFSCE